VEKEKEDVRILITGGRTYQNKEKVFRILNEYKEADHIGLITIIHGGAAGADSLANEWGKENNMPIEVYKAEWDLYGKAAGPIRNKLMASKNIDFAIAFPGGKGTRNMISICSKNNISIIDCSYDKD